MKTLFDKVWDNHVVAQEEDETLLYVDRCLIHEGTRHTFDTLHERDLTVAHPDKILRSPITTSQPIRKPGRAVSPAFLMRKFATWSSF